MNYRFIAAFCFAFVAAAMHNDCFAAKKCEHLGTGKTIIINHKHTCLSCEKKILGDKQSPLFLACRNLHTICWDCRSRLIKIDHQLMCPVDSCKRNMYEYVELPESKWKKKFTSLLGKIADDASPF